MHGIVFLDDAQRVRYDVLVSRRTSEPKYVDLELLRSLSLWDELDALFGVYGMEQLCAFASSYVWEIYVGVL